MRQQFPAGLRGDECGALVQLVTRLPVARLPRLPVAQAAMAAPGRGEQGPA